MAPDLCWPRQCRDHPRGHRLTSPTAWSSTRATGEAVAQGKAVFFDGQDRLVGERSRFQPQDRHGVVYKGSDVRPALLSPLRAIAWTGLGESVYSVRQGIFTTCEGDDPAWSFRLARP